jgi:hypothetical protein
MKIKNWSLKIPVRSTGLSFPRYSLHPFIIPNKEEGFTDIVGFFSDVTVGSRNVQFALTT